MIEYFKIALKNISKRKKRAALTMLGVFIGIAAVVALVSLGQGLSSTINAQFEKIGGDKIIIQAKELGFTGKQASGPLTERELSIVEGVAGVSRVAGSLLTSARVVFKDVQRTLFVLSMPESADAARLMTQVNTWEIDVGRLVDRKDKGKAMIGDDIATTKFGKEVGIGDKLKVNDEMFEVVGVLKGTGDPSVDTSVVMSESDARRISNESELFSYIVAQSDRGANPEDVADRIERRIRRDRHQDEGKEDFSVTTSTELIASFNTVLNIVQFVFVGIAGISLFVGGIGIMNTMFTAVLERTREIGVMKAIGARNRDVLMIFMLESGMLGLAGGIIGLLIGVGISKSVEFGVNAAFGAGTLTAIVPWYLIVGALLFGAVVGAVSGVLPARRASRLRPVDALRYE